MTISFVKGIAILLAVAAALFGGLFWYFVEQGGETQDILPVASHPTPAASPTPFVTENGTESDSATDAQDFSGWRILNLRDGATLRIPPGPDCGDSEALFVCVKGYESSVFILYNWPYEENDIFACGRNFEECRSIVRDGYSSLDYEIERTIAPAVRGIEFRGMSNWSGESRQYRDFLVESANASGTIRIMQTQFLEEIDGFYEKMLTTLEL